MPSTDRSYQIFDFPHFNQARKLSSALTGSIIPPHIEGTEVVGSKYFFTIRWSVENEKGETSIERKATLLNESEVAHLIHKLEAMLLLASSEEYKLAKALADTGKKGPKVTPAKEPF